MSRVHPCVAFLLLVCVMAGPAAGQSRPSSRRLAKNPLDLMALPPAPEGVRPGKAPIVTVDGTQLGTGDYAREIVAFGASAAVDTLVRRRALEVELAKRKIKLEADDIEQEAIRLLATFDPHEPWSSVAMEPGLANDLRAQARDALGWRWVQKNPDEEKPAVPSSDPGPSRIMSGIQANKVMEAYKVKRADAGDQLQPGIAAELTDSDGKTHDVTDRQVLDQLRLATRYEDLVAARDALVDDWLVGRALAAAGESITGEDVVKFVAAMNAKYKPPFEWKMICQFKGTTRAKETSLFRRVSAWKKITGFTTKPDDLAAFTNERETYFRGEHRQVKQVLFRTVEALTGAPLDSGAEEQAAAEAKQTHAALVKGADFTDTAVAKTQDVYGAIHAGEAPYPFKRFDTNLDQALRDAVFALTDEQPLSKPVKGSKGWYIFHLEKATAPSAKTDLKSPQFAEWIQDEFERNRFAAWMAALRKDAKIALGPESALSGW